MKNYKYYIQNLSVEKFAEIQEKIANIDLVKEVKIENEHNKISLEYILDDQTDEYGVFVKAIEILQDEGADIAFDDEKQFDIVEPTFEDSEIEQTTQEEKPKKKKSIAKMPDYLSRVAEVIVGVLFFMLFGFSNRMMAGLCLVVVSYEIFYELLSDLAKKKFTDNLPISVAILCLSICGAFTSAFYLAVGFSVLKILNGVAQGYLKRKTESCLTEKIELENGEQIEVEKVTEGLEIIVEKTVYFPCEIVDGEVQVLREGKTILLKVGDKLDFGDKLLKRQTVIAKTLCDYNLSQFKTIRESQKALINQTVEKQNKKLELVYISLAIAGLIYCFISPLFFDGSYAYNLASQGVKGALVIALSSPILAFWQNLRIELFKYACLKNIEIIDLYKTLQISNYKEFVYNEQVFLTDELHKDAYGMIREVKDLGVQTQTAISLCGDSLNQTCDQLKLKNRVENISQEELQTLTQNAIYYEKSNGKIIAKQNDQTIFTAKEENLRAIPKTFKNSKKAKLLKKISMVSCVAIQALLIVLGVGEILSIATSICLALTLTGLVGALNFVQLSEV